MNESCAIASATVLGVPCSSGPVGPARQAIQKFGELARRAAPGAHPPFQVTLQVIQNRAKTILVLCRSLAHAFGDYQSCK